MPPSEYSLRTLARKMVYRNTPEYEDVFQEVWIAGWRSAQQNPSRGYIAKSMLNRGNDARRGARLGSSRTNHGGRGRLLVHSVQHSYPDFLEPSRDDNYPSDLDWATRVAQTPAEKHLLAGVLTGLTPTAVARSMGYSPSWGSKYWGKLRTKLQQAWRETQV